MSSPIKTTDTDNEFVSAIPPVISNNPREKIAPELVPVNEILLRQRRKCIPKQNANTGIFDKLNVPFPRYPLSIAWSPSVMLFEIDNTLILQKLRIWNVCSRSVYIVFCGLWGDNARLGAKWRCFPRTRNHLAPGLTADIFIQATPREQSPIPSAQIAIQLAAAHKRDNVVGYFAIPIIVKFNKYIYPCLDEENDSKTTIIE